MNKPTVSFLVAAYNEEEFLAECIMSCLEQDGVSVEVCVVDDGSVDSTRKVLSGFVGDSRVKVIHFEENRGKVAAFNAAFQMSTCDYIALIGADDVSLRDRALQSLRLIEVSGARLVYGDYCICNERLEPRSAKVVAPDVRIEDLAFNNKLPGGTFLFDRVVASEVFPIPVELGFEDWWISFVAVLNFDVAKVRAPLIKYRHHSANDSRSRVGEGFKERDFKRHLVYYDAFLSYLSRRQDENLSLVGRLHEAKLFKELYLTRSGIARIALFGRFVVKRRGVHTSLGFASFVVMLPFGRSLFDLMVRVKGRRSEVAFDG